MARTVLLGCGGVALVAFVLLAFGGLLITRKLRAFDEFAKKTAAEYEALSAAHGFTPPEPGEGAGRERTSAYLRVRSEVMETIPADLDSLVEQWLAEGDLSNRRIIANLGKIVGFLERAVEAHLEALGREDMSPEEFLWLHGYVVHGVWEGPSEDARRKRLESLVAALERSSQDEGDWNSRFESERYREELHESYSRHGAPDAATLEQFESATTLGVLLDLLAASPELRRSLEEVFETG